MSKRLIPFFLILLQASLAVAADLDQPYPSGWEDYPASTATPMTAAKLQQIEARIDRYAIVEDKDLTTAPTCGAGQSGYKYIVAGIGGVWSGCTINDIARCTGVTDTWSCTTPVEGYIARVSDEDRLYQYTGSAWSDTINTAAINLSGESVVALSPDNTTVQLNGSNELEVKDSGISSTKITDGTIANADISVTAGIVGSKLDLSEPGAIGATTPAAGTFTTVTGNTSVVTDTITEKTTDAGVTVEGVLVKDGSIPDFTEQDVIAKGDALVGFKQDLTSTQGYTVDGKLRQLISVLDWIPGAEHAAILAGTSITDLTTYIQAAVDNVPAYHDLYFPGLGPYKITSVISTTRSNIRLVGNGAKIVQATSQTSGILFDGSDNVQVIGLWLYGPGDGTTATASLTFKNCTNSKALNNKIENWSNNVTNYGPGGIYLRGRSKWCMVGYNYIVDTNNAINEDAYEQNGDGPQGNLVIGNIIRNCRAGILTDNKDAAGTIFPGASVVGNLIYGVTALGFGEKYGIKLHDVYGQHVAGNQILHNYDGIIVSSLVKGSRIANNTVWVTEGGQGIKVIGNASTYRYASMVDIDGNTIVLEDDSANGIYFAERASMPATDGKGLNITNNTILRVNQTANADITYGDVLYLDLTNGEYFIDGNKSYAEAAASGWSYQIEDNAKGTFKFGINNFTGTSATTETAGLYNGVSAAFLGTGTPTSSTYLSGAGTWTTPAGTGDVVGPASATDNAIARFDATTGKLLQNSGVTIDDNGVVNIPAVGAYQKNGVVIDDKKVSYAATENPNQTAYDTDTGWSVGSRIINVNNDMAFIAVDVTSDAAIWEWINYKKGPNALTNGGFEAGTYTEGWTTYVNTGGGASATFSKETSDVSDGSAALSIAITTATATTTNVQFYHPTTNDFIPGEQYLLSFKAKSSGSSTVNVAVYLNQSPWTSFGAATITIGSSWQTFTVPVSALTNPVNVRFSLGYSANDGDTILFDDVAMTRHGGGSELVETRTAIQMYKPLSAPAKELISSALADTSTPHTVTALEVSGTILNNYNASPSAREFDLPAIAKGLNFKFALGDANNVTLDPNGTEYMMLDGTLMAAGEAIVNTTTPAIGDAIVCNAFQVGASTYYWDCRTLSGDWTQETP